MYKYCNTFDGRILSKSKKKNIETKKTEKKQQTNKEEKEKSRIWSNLSEEEKEKNNNMVTSDVEIIQKMKNKSWLSIEKTILKCINPNKAGYF